jgi:amino acid adenylation domain-containing protein/non-ribosomal peptide synthase protein (TIGR01720 family)
MPIPDWHYVCLHTLVEVQAAERPTAPALLHGDEVITYGSLNRRANRLARHLEAAGVRRGDRVGIHLGRSMEVVAVMLAISKLGAAYLSLDERNPPDRLARMCETAGFRALVTAAARAGALKGVAPTTIDLEADEDVIRARSDVDLRHHVSLDDAAQLIFTSGSTGQPKGIVVPHRSLVGFAFGEPWLNLGPDETFLQWSSTSWDAITLEMWLAFRGGARCVWYPTDMPTPEGLAGLIEAHDISAVWLNCSLFNVMIETIPESLSRVRCLLVGSEAASPAHVMEAVRRLPQTVLVNTYGPSECGALSTGYVIPPDLPANAERIPIGHAIGDRKVYLLNDHLQKRPATFVGQIYVGGPGVGDGYLGRPDLTAERFLPDPFSDVPGARIYRTGDLGRARRNGEIEFLGRADHQVKIRGQRVELGEIEAVLTRHADVRQAAALVSDTDVSRRIIAYVSPRVGASLSGEAIRAWTRERLPSYMVPSALVVLTDLPLTPNGKIDRRALPPYVPTTERERDREASADGAAATETGTDGEVDASSGATTNRGPRTPTEQVLVEVWRDVLGRTQVGVDDNFFELGGDSILSIQIATRARPRGVTVSTRDLFVHQTIAALAVVADAAASDAAADKAPVPASSMADAMAGDALVLASRQTDVRASVDPAADLASAVRIESHLASASPSSEPVPLTSIQRWFFGQAHPERHHFNQSLVLSAREPIALPALAAAVTAVVAHHAALRLRFGKTADGWHAWLAASESSATSALPAATAPVLACIDLRDVSADAHARVWMSMATEAQRSLDLTTGPLLRVIVARTRAGERVLLIAHHLVMDGVSWRVLLDDLARAYAEARRGAAIALGRPSTAWPTWAAALATYAAGPTLAAERAQWATVVEVGAIAPALTTPSDHAMQGRARRVPVTLSIRETQALVRGIAREWRASTEAALLAAVGAALSAGPMRRSGSAASGDWLIDLEGHGRESATVDPRIDLSRTIGWFTTIYPVRVSSPAGRPWRAVVQEMHARLAAVPHKGLGYGLLRWMPGGASPDPALWPASVASVNYLGQWDRVLAPDGPFGAADDPTGPPSSPLTPMPHALAFNAQVWRDQLRVQITYDPAHHEAVIDDLRTTLQTALQAIAAEVESDDALAVPADDLAGVLDALRGASKA